MSRPFAAYPLSFDGYSRGYWRFAETGGRLAGVIGPTMTRNVDSPEAVEQGYQFDVSLAQQMQAVLPALGETLRNLTYECWFRDWANLATIEGQLLRYQYDSSNRTMLAARRTAAAADSYISATLRFGGAWMPTAQWKSADVAALLDSPEWIHVAVVFDGWSPRTLRLFVNGVLRAETTPTADGFPNGTHYFWIGYGSLSSPMTSIVDEVRVSRTSRYATDFTPMRYGEGRRGLARGPGLQGLFAGVRQ